jgi:hypothetical protein
MRCRTKAREPLLQFWFYTFVDRDNSVEAVWKRPIYLKRIADKGWRRAPEQVHILCEIIMVRALEPEVYSKLVQELPRTLITAGDRCDIFEGDSPIGGA